MSQKPAETRKTQRSNPASMVGRIVPNPPPSAASAIPASRDLPRRVGDNPPYHRCRIASLRALRVGGVLCFEAFLALLCVRCHAPAMAQSPFAKVEPLALGEGRWGSGFWAERFELCRTQMVPSME